MVTNNLSFILALIFFIIVLIFNKKIAKKIILDQNKKMGFNFSEREIKITEKLLVIISFLFLIFTLTIKLGFIR